MSGFTKDNITKLEDSNIAGLGSDLDKQCRVDAAGLEAAWKTAGKKPGMQIWRIEKFQVKASTTPVGHFYSGDSYICLNTYKKKDDEGKETEKLGWDIHFWLGKDTTQDEMGTAAYKTVELDDFLGGEPVQHREVQECESAMFVSYFEAGGGLRLLEGGIESGFNHVKPEEYKPRLYHIKGRRNVRVVQVEMKVESMCCDDVFVLDCGMKIYMWQGKKGGVSEKSKANQLAVAIDNERGGKPERFTYSQGDSDEKEFWDAFPGVDAVPEITNEGGDDKEFEKADASKKVLMQVSDAGGKLEFKKVAEGAVKKDMLKTEDVFIFDTGAEIFVWIGKGASKEEKRSGMKFAGDYLKDNARPPFLPITKLVEGGENEVFKNAFV